MTYRYAVHFEFFMHLHAMNTENNNNIITIMIIVKILFCLLSYHHGCWY